MGFSQDNPLSVCVAALKRSSRIRLAIWCGYLVSFLAREVFVGALGTLFGIQGADENIAGLAANIQQDGLALRAGIGLMLFYVVALQCAATIATIKGETGSGKIARG